MSETKYAKIVERNGWKVVVYAVGGKDAEWYEKRGFMPCGGIEPVEPALAGRRTVGTTSVVIGGRIIRARVYENQSPADYDKVMEDYLAAVRSERGYTTREPDDYFGSSVPRWAQDAADWMRFRDAVMLYGLKVQNDYAATGNAPTIAEFKANLPQIEWTWKDADATSSVQIENHVTVEGEAQ